MNKEHLMNEYDPVGTIPVRDRSDPEPPSDEKQKERPTSGMRLENFIGLWDDEEGDEFIETVREIRRGVARTEPRS
jgi:hypothetical protein